MDFSEKVQWLGDLGIVFSLPEDISSLLFLRKRFYLFNFRDSGREGERERNINVWVPLEHPVLGTWPTTQACALTGN